MAINPRSFLLRVGSTVVFVPLFFWLVKYLSVYWFFGMVLVIMALGVVEFRNLSKAAGRGYYLAPSLVVMVLAAASRVWPVIAFDAVIMTGFVGVLLWSLLVDRKIDTALDASAHTLLGTLYFAVPLSAMVALKNSDHLVGGYAGMGADLVFTLFLVVWLGDSGAYLIGSMIGRHRLAPSISPKKSVEGGIANVVFNVVGATIAKLWFFHRLTWTDVAVIGLLIGTTGMLGDLVESMWKRKAGIKDSAGLIPGHGGLLDRLDSFVLSAPLLYLYFRYFMG